MPVVSIERAEPISTCWASGDHRASPLGSTQAPLEPDLDFDRSNRCSCSPAPLVSPHGTVVFGISDIDQFAYRNTPPTIF